ncbi:transposase IS4 family protein [Streptomyces iranensis]|uniref:Transposase n=1 Tax=Streptomyces iranensis TaxID=576784 RepID=A0A060ZXG5_9ACTN|nr:transposase [Streptomyces iranensis]CDR10785.1 transposase IS4 family protein [Streptomyces iranensis]
MQTHHQGRHPGEEGPGRQPEEEGQQGGRPVSHDADLYKERNTVERLINKLKAWRGIATRYDKTPESYLAGFHLRASMIWIKDLTRTTH